MNQGDERTTTGSTPAPTDRWLCPPVTQLWWRGRKPAVAEYIATEGRSRRLSLSPAGASGARLPAPATRPATTAGQDLDAANGSARGTAGELVLARHGRLTLEALEFDGDRRVVDLLVYWDPDE